MKLKRSDTLVLAVVGGNKTNWTFFLLETLVGNKTKTSFRYNKGNRTTSEWQTRSSAEAYKGTFKQVQFGIVIR